MDKRASCRLLHFKNICFYFCVFFPLASRVPGDKDFFKSIWNDAGIRHVPEAFCKQIKAAVCREDSSLLAFAAVFHGDDI